MQRNYKLFIFSLFLLNLFWWISAVEAQYGIPQLVKYILSISSLCIIIYYKLINPSKPVPGGLIYAAIIFFVIWSIFLFLSASVNFRNFQYVQRIFGQPHFIIPYIIPVFLLFSRFDIEFFSDYFHYCFLLLIPAILIELYIVLTGVSRFNWGEQILRISIFDLGSYFLLLTAQLSKKKYVFTIALFYSLLMIFLLAQFGRRGSFIEYVLILSYMIIMRLRSPVLNRNDRFLLYFAGLFMIVILMTYGHLASSSYIFERGLSKDAFEASRGTVFESFFLDFNTTSDFIFGRGLEGTVLRSTFTGTEADYIENGFLILMLKGGILYLIPFLLILFRAIFLGIYKSNNDLVKALAYLLLIYLIIMVGYNVPLFSTKYIVMWISVSACFTPELRNASNEEIYRRFNTRRGS